MSAYGRGGDLGIWQFLPVGCAVHLGFSFQGEGNMRRFVFIGFYAPSF
jgi:hypothetical protein